jgi:hypothetical protein
MLMAAGEGNASTFNTTLAAFLITRPPYAYLGYGWENCGAPNVAGRLPGTTRDVWQPMFDLDVGEPTGLCAETSAGVFERNWSKGRAALDCNRFEATLDFALKTDDRVGPAEPELRTVESVGDTIIRNDVGLWNDAQGNPLHAHGGGMYTEAGLFYWVGAYTLGPDLPYEDSYSIALYSSTNLGDWELRSSSILNKSAFTNGCFQSPVINASDPVELYRPKLIRSAATGKYVLWSGFMQKAPAAGFERTSGVCVASAATIDGEYTLDKCMYPNALPTFDVTVIHDGGDHYVIADTEHHYEGISKISESGLSVSTADCTTVQCNNTPACSRLDYGWTTAGEAPAFFRAPMNSRAYLWTSHLSGWSPNAAMLYEGGAQGLCGQSFRLLGNPSLSATTHNSQSTFILPIAHQDNSTTLLYMGDRWCPNFPNNCTGDVTSATYVWLPLYPNASALSGWSLPWLSHWRIGDPQFRIRAKTDEVLVPATIGQVDGDRAAPPRPSLAHSRVGDAWGTNIHWFHETAPGEAAMLSGAFKLARIGFSWSEIERARGQYNFSQYDGLRRTLREHGVRPYWVLQRGNPLYASSVAAEKRGCNSSECLHAFGDFAAAAARHFGAASGSTSLEQIIWECTNEPNGHVRLADGSVVHAVSPATLVAQCTQAGMAFKRFGQLFVGPTTTAFDWEYINSTIAGGLLSAVGGMSIHGYRVPNQVPETILSDWAQLRHMTQQYGRSREEKTMPMISGEWGYTTARAPCSDPYRVSETLQASYLARMWLVNTLAGVSVSINYDWRDDGTILTSGEAHYGAVREARSTVNGSMTPFEPKPKYTAALALQRGLGNFQSFAGRVHPFSITPTSAPLDGIYVLRFENQTHNGSSATAGFAVWTNGSIVTGSCGGDPGNRTQCGHAGIFRDECLSPTNPRCKGKGESSL